MSQNLINKKIGITGLGLIGGSIYKGLLSSGFNNFYIHSSNNKTIDIVRNAGKNASSDITILSECDIIFICSPISMTTKMIKQVHSVNETALLVDVASLKKNILEFAENIGCKFIGSHPMAGTENSGFQASFSSLFNGAIWVLTPSKFATGIDIKILEEIIEILGAVPYVVDAFEHDIAVAKISHLPMLLAQSLVGCNLDNNLSLKLAASGFKDMTRLAMSNSCMASDMLKFNKENIKQALDDIMNEAQKLLSNEKYFNEKIENIITLRKKMYDNNGKNIY